jgi:hypothetical protein
MKIAHDMRPSTSFPTVIGLDHSKTSTRCSLFDQQRPCARCVKRDIGHLCHDEPKESAKKSKIDVDRASVDDETSLNANIPPINQNAAALDSRPTQPDGAPNLGSNTVTESNNSNTGSNLQPAPVSAAQSQPLVTNSHVCAYNVPFRWLEHY